MNVLNVWGEARTFKTFKTIDPALWMPSQTFKTFKTCKTFKHVKPLKH